MKKSNSKNKKIVVLAGKELELSFSKYVDKSVCIMARNLDTNVQNNVTVNVLDIELEEGFTLIKNVGELEGIYEVLVKEGIIKEATSKVPVGSYYALLCQII